MNTYNGLFDSKDSIISNFMINESNLDEVEILYSEYDYEDYSGSAWVLFRKDDMLYEVSGSHCSCNGLEGQWEPSFTTIKTLLMRPHLNKSLRQMLVNNQTT